MKSRGLILVVVIALVIPVVFAMVFERVPPTEIGVPNMVTSVLASYRGYDTLGEVAVIFTAAIAVLALIGRGGRRFSESVRGIPPDRDARGRRVAALRSLGERPARRRPA